MYTLDVNRELAVMYASILCMPHYVKKHKLYPTHFLTAEEKLVINDLDIILMNICELYTYESSTNHVLQRGVNYFNWQQIGRQKCFK